MLAAGCGAPDTKGDDTSEASGKPQVVEGWLDEYSSRVESEVSAHYAALLELPSSSLTALYSSWGGFDREARRRLWRALLWFMAGPESNRNRTLIHLETTPGKDSVTGEQIRSEGLLQLSYQDVRNYRYPRDDIF